MSDEKQFDIPIISIDGKEYYPADKVQEALKLLMMRIQETDTIASRRGHAVASGGGAGGFQIGAEGGGSARAEHIPVIIPIPRADAPLHPAELMARCPAVAFAVAALQHAAQNMLHPDPMIDAALAPFTKGSDG